MPAEVQLRCESGQWAGQIFTFTQKDAFILGRSAECRLRVAEDARGFVSRHHCQFEINPPHLQVADLGSLNGTFVNDVRIESSSDRPNATPARLLQHGDRLRIGDTEFTVLVLDKKVCAECCGEFSVPYQEHGGAAPDYCKVCIAKRATVYEPVDTTTGSRFCVNCGATLAHAVNVRGRCQPICERCLQEPSQIYKLLQTTHALPAFEEYAIVRLLDRGGMGAVYLAQSEQGQQVAIKVILPELAANAEATQRFLREIRYIKAARHPHIVQMIDAGAADGVFFVVLEYCSGGSLDAYRAKAGGKLKPALAVRWCREVLLALEHTHQLPVPVRLASGEETQAVGLVHRDIKPQNILLSNPADSAIAKLSDFGFAKAFETAGLTDHTWTGQTCGSPFFVTRQQVIDFRSATPEVDVWSVAATLYNVLTGKYPRDFVPGKDPWQIILDTAPVPIRKRDASVPRKLADLIDYALQEEPEIPIKSAREFRNALADVPLE